MIDVQDKHDHWRVSRIHADANANYVEQWRRKYTTFGDIPKLTQTAVAVLTMQDDLGEVKGLGRRVSSEVFWLEETKELLEEYERADDVQT